MKTRLSCVLLAGALVSGCGGTAPPPFRPIVDVKALMDAVMEPQADIIWESVGTIITVAGVEERRPRTQEAWDAVHNAAVTLAETGNLLMMAPRAKGPQYGVDWIKLAAELTDASEQAMKAADAKDPATLFNIGADVYEKCVNCHSHYMQAILDVRKP
jgi:hypothetical protein